MKYAICNELFDPTNWEPSASRARELGYTGLEVAPFTLPGTTADAISPATRERFRAQVRACDMEVIGLHWLLAKTEGYHLTTSDKKTREKTAQYLALLVELCADLGGSVMVLGSPHQRNFPEDMTHTEAMKNAADVLSQLVVPLTECNVELAIEPLGPEEGNFLNTAASARELMALVDAPNVRLHLDVKAMSTEDQSIPEIIRDNADAVCHFHANDPNRLGPGMGDVAFAPIFSALDEIGYDRWVSVEVFDYSPGVDAILTESMQAMRAAERAIG